MFEGWADHPPTNLLVKAIVEGFGGTKPTASTGVYGDDNAVFQKDAQSRMQASATVAAIQAKAGHLMPVIRGKDSGLPKASPVFDEEVLRKRNEEVRLRMKTRK